MSALSAGSSSCNPAEVSVAQEEVFVGLLIAAMIVGIFPFWFAKVIHRFTDIKMPKKGCKGLLTAYVATAAFLGLFLAVILIPAATPAWVGTDLSFQVDNTRSQDSWGQKAEEFFPCTVVSGSLSGNASLIEKKFDLATVEFGVVVNTTRCFVLVKETGLEAKRNILFGFFILPVLSPIIFLVMKLWPKLDRKKKYRVLRSMYCCSDLTSGLPIIGLWTLICICVMAVTIGISFLLFDDDLQKAVDGGPGVALRRCAAWEIPLILDVVPPGTVLECGSFDWPQRVLAMALASWPIMQGVMAVADSSQSSSTLAFMAEMAFVGVAISNVLNQNSRSPAGAASALPFLLPISTALYVLGVMCLWLVPRFLVPDPRDAVQVAKPVLLAAVFVQLNLFAAAFLMTIKVIVVIQQLMDLRSVKLAAEIKRLKSLEEAGIVDSAASGIEFDSIDFVDQQDSLDQIRRARKATVAAHRAAKKAEAADQALKAPDKV